MVDGVLKNGRQGIGFHRQSVERVLGESLDQMGDSLLQKIEIMNDDAGVQIVGKIPLLE